MKDQLDIEYIEIVCCLDLDLVFLDPQTEEFHVLSVLTPSRVQTLFECLTDTFEQNKMEAFNILSALPSSCLNIQVHNMTSRGATGHTAHNLFTHPATYHVTQKWGVLGELRKQCLWNKFFKEQRTKNLKFWNLRMSNKSFYLLYICMYFFLKKSISNPIIRSLSKEYYEWLHAAFHNIHKIRISKNECTVYIK
jgi:hypothetical protein